MPRSVLSVCTVSQAENRKDSACRMVELRTTSGVGNSSATEAVSRLSWGGCSMRRTWGTRRSIFPAASRRAVNRDMAVGSIIFTANTPSSVNNSTPDYRRCSGKCRVKRELSADRIGAMRKRKKPTASKGSSTRESGAQNGRKFPADAMFI